MLLYTEEQLERAYEIYRTHQIKQDLSFMSLEHFRVLYEVVIFATNNYLYQIIKYFSGHLCFSMQPITIPSPGFCIIFLNAEDISYTNLF